MKPLYSFLNKNEIVLTCVGDILAHEEVIWDAENKNGYDFDKMFDLVRPIIKDSDIAFCNQESLIGGAKQGLHGGEFKKIGFEKNPVFNSPFELGDAVYNCGFNMISLANNHVLDNGEASVRNSIQFWHEKNVITSGSWNTDINRKLGNAKIYSKNGIKFAFLAYTTRYNSIIPEPGKEYLTNIFSKEKAAEDIKQVRDRADVVIVSMHWGTEYNLGKTDSEQRDIARFLSELGVDLIIGHHPHVIEPIERINNTIVIYSLGNFIACQTGDVLMKRIGAIVKVKIKKTNNKVKIDLINTELTYIYYNSKEHTDFKIIPFHQLGDKHLRNYKEIEKEYKKYIKYNG